MSKGKARLYYETHITVEPMQAESFSYEDFAARMAALGWRASKFEHDDVDQIAGKWFLSNKDQRKKTIKKEVPKMLKFLREKGFTVERWKIEKAVLDSKYGDTEDMLK